MTNRTPMRPHDTISHDVRRLHATGTTDELIRYVEHEVGESYVRGFRAGYRRSEGAALRTLLWRSVRRTIRQLVRRMV
jgi:hypothetical protein